MAPNLIFIFSLQAAFPKKPLPVDHSTPTKIQEFHHNPLNRRNTRRISTLIGTPERKQLMFPRGLGRLGWHFGGGNAPEQMESSHLRVTAKWNCFWRRGHRRVLELFPRHLARGTYRSHKAKKIWSSRTQHFRARPYTAWRFVSWSRKEFRASVAHRIRAFTSRWRGYCDRCCVFGNS